MASKYEWNPAAVAEKGPLQQLIEISRYYGADPDFVLAGGGNTSVKIGGDLYIKGSGYPLATLDENGLVRLDREKVRETLVKSYSESSLEREEQIKQDLLAARREPEKCQRPSVETALHELISRTFVVHTHPWLVNTLTCAVNGQETIQRLFGDEALWLDYTDPGYVLAKSVEKALADYRARTGKGDPSIIFLKNHGVFVSADNVLDIKTLTDKIVTKLQAEHERAGSQGFGPRFVDIEPDCKEAFINHLGPALRALLAENGLGKIVAFDDSSLVLDLVCAENGKEIALGGPLNPDQIVYCKSFPLWVDRALEDSPQDACEKLAAALALHQERWNYDPKVVLVEGLGMFTVGDTPKAAYTVQEVYKDAVKVMAGNMAFGGPRYLSPRERQFIDEWEVEQYRRKVAASANSGGRAQGKIAFVTGAAQGFGKEIAEDLAEQGAIVVLADVNPTGVETACEELLAKHGEYRALAVQVDVSNGASTAAAVHRAVRAYGGLDVVISNAGVLRAGSVKTQPEEEFDFVTRVNYTGYFICVKYTAPIMSVQHQYNTKCWGDIIQINSKSGLEGSNKNGAYAGSKFGGIGLTQSFALELVEDGIKVNSICPGNFLDGPLWSDPNNGLFVQYLRTGKVPGAKSIEDVRRFYEDKVPMRRGCTTADVMKAVYYLMDQMYETGQALPVTGGQVMLK